jgi:hypothetical protein
VAEQARREVDWRLLLPHGRSVIGKLSVDAIPPVDKRQMRADARILRERSASCAAPRYEYIPLTIALMD